MMPEFGGPETIAELNRLAPALPVLVMSGYAADDVISSLEALRICGFLPKPCTRAQLLAAVREALGAEPPA